MRQIRREEREFMDELSPHQMCARVRVCACAYMYAYIFIYNLYPCFKLKEHGRDWEHTFKLPNASSHFVGLSPTPQKKKKRKINILKSWNLMSALVQNVSVRRLWVRMHFVFSKSWPLVPFNLLDKSLLTDCLPKWDVSQGAHSAECARVYF